MRRLGIFLQAPLPGRVKSLLADEVGPSAASEVQWQIGRRIVSQVTSSGYRTTIWFAPPSEGAFVREWLDGVGRVDLRQQPSGNRGERVAHAFTRMFAEGAKRAVIIGSDCPGVSRRLVAEAFNALAACDVVLGPTSLGGWYLIGLNAPQPALFRALKSPLGKARAQVQTLGLRLKTLRPLREVRTAHDARALGLLRSRSTIDGTYC